MPVLRNTGSSRVNSAELPPNNASILVATSSWARRKGGFVVAVDKMRADCGMNELSKTLGAATGPGIVQAFIVWN